MSEDEIVLHCTAKYFLLRLYSSIPDVTEKSVTLSSECDTEGGNKQVQVCVTVERNDCWEVFLHAQHWLINKTGLPLQMKVLLFY